ncbi:MAG: hypothetical protein CSB49_04785 [Proteobacteria bacterium]|nr:MAG: hypothetical protein CSB49_04785 [Pseudomonadota bacterium]
MFKPQQFGKYYLTERVAIGGMAEIYKATLYGVSGFEKAMVVKQILPQYARNAEFIKMFIDEAKISVSLSHGNIIPVYELGRIDGIYFIAMEYVDGKNLGEIFEAAKSRGMPISVEHAIFIAIEVCKGLDYAHRRSDDEGQPLGVVHRDLSPGNVLVTRAGEIKITDFGIAKAKDKLGVTAVGVIKGSHGYMSPEQVKGQEVDPRTDIFSTGILLHEMLTGRRLFDGSDANVIDRIKEAIVTLPSMISPAVPVELDPVVLQALAKSPDDRFQDANELQLALSRLLFSIGAGATNATLADYMGELFPKDDTPQAEETLVEGKPPPANVASRSPEPGFDSADTSVIDDDDDVTIAARAVADATRSYAVRDDLEQRYHEQLASEGKREAVQTTAPGVAKKGKTLTLPALDDEEEPTRVSAPIARPRSDGAPSPALGDLPATEFEDAPTMLAAPRPAPPRLEVPELKIKATRPREPKLDDSINAFARALSSVNGPNGGQLNTGPRPLSEPADLFAPLTGPQPSEGQGRERRGKEAALLAAMSGGESSLEATKRHDTPDEMINASRRTEPAGEAPASLARGGGPTDKPADGSDRPDPAQDPQVLLAPTKRRGPRSDESVMALLVAPGGDTGAENAIEQPDIGRLGGGGSVLDVPPSASDPLDAPLPAGATPSSLGKGRSRRRTSGVFSSTMNLLVQGLDDEPSPEAPRNIKPTMIGWLVILLLVGAAGFFVIYKKTSWLGGKPKQAGGELLALGDIGKGSGAGKKDPPTKQKGAITITADPAQALIFLHVGDSPVTRRFDTAKTYLLRAEREGYGTVHQLIEPGKLTERTVALSLPPRGAGQKRAMPSNLPTPTSPGGKTVELTVATEPPSASVWLLVGKGKAELVGVEPKRHYFKVLAEGHQTSFLSISSSRFDTTQKVEESLKLTAKAGVDAGAKASSPDAGAKKAAMKPNVAPTKPARKTPPAKGAKVLVKKKKKKKKQRWRKRPKKRKKKTTLQTPSWAR